MQLEKNLSDDNDEDNNQELEKELCSLMDGLRITTGQGDSKNSSKRSTPYTRSATSHFGFKKRAHSAAPPSTKHQLQQQQQQQEIEVPSGGGGGTNNKTTVLSNNKANKNSKDQQTLKQQIQGNIVDNRVDDSNGNSGSLDSLTSPGRNSPRLAPPRKEAAGGTLRTNRFGFRQQAPASHGPQPVRGPLGQLTNRVGDVARTDGRVTTQAYQNNKTNNNNINGNNTNNTEKQRPRSCEGQYQTITRQQTQIKLKGTTITNTNDQVKNQQNTMSRPPQQQLNFPIRPTLTSGPIVANPGIVSAQRSKLAKQAVNNGVRRREQSACGRMQSVGGDITDPSKGYRGRPRNLEVVMTGAHGFEVRDTDDSSIEEPVLPLPKLPSAFSNAPAVPLNTGLVRERTGDLQRLANVQTNQRELNSQGSTASGSSSSASTSSNFALRTQTNPITDLFRKPSNSSSEGFAYDDEEKANRDKDISEKTTQLSRDFSAPSSKNSSPGSKGSSNNWGLDCGGEDLAPADVLSLDSNSGSASNLSPEDQTSGNAKLFNTSLTRNTGLQALMSSSLLGSSGSAASTLLLRSAIEHDPKFAAVAAAAAVDSCLLDDETSPVDSLISSTSSVSDSCNEDDVDGALGTKKISVTKDKDKDKDKDKEVDSLADQEPPSNMMIGAISSPGTPTNASNSLSLSDGGRDYFDDEIADQPALVFNDKNNTSSADGLSTSLQLVSLTDNTLTSGGQDVPNNLTHTLIGPRIQPLANNKVVQTFNSQPAASLIQSAVLANANHPVSNLSPSSLRLRRNGPNELSRCGSLDTLSPCESIASDDLMMDFDHSQSSLESDRAESGHGSALHSLDETQIMNELAQQGGQVMKEWTTLLNARQLTNGGRTEVNGSSQSQQPASVQPPARTARLLQRARASPPPGVRRTPIFRPPPHQGSPTHQTTNGCPPTDMEDGGAWIDRSTHNAIMQDVVGIKTMLLKLKRVLHETETMNPFDRHLNSPRHSADSGMGASSASNGDSLEMADLKRQVVFLQTQLEDKERTVQLLQLQMTKYSQNRTNGLQGNQNQNQVLSNLPINGVSEDKAVNAATQTERLRPMSTGPTTYQQLGEANGLLSASDSSDGGSEKTRKRLTNASSLPRRLNRTSNNSAQQSSTLHTDMKHTSLCCRCRKEILDCTNNGSSADTRSDDSQRSRKRSGSRTRSQKTNGCTNKLESKDSSDCDGQLAKPRSKSTPRLRSSKKYPSDIYLLPSAKNSADVCDLPNGACVMMSSNGSQNVISNCNSLGSSSEFLNGGTVSRIGRMKRTNV